MIAAIATVPSTNEIALLIPFSLTAAESFR